MRRPTVLGVITHGLTLGESETINCQPKAPTGYRGASAHEKACAVSGATLESRSAGIASRPLYEEWECVEERLNCRPSVPERSEPYAGRDTSRREKRIKAMPNSFRFYCKKPCQSQADMMRDDIAQTSGEAKKPGPSTTMRVARRVAGRILNNAVAEATGGAININKAAGTIRRSKKRQTRMRKIPAAFAQSGRNSGPRVNHIKQGIEIEHEEMVGQVTGYTAYSAGHSVISATVIEPGSTTGVAAGSLLQVNPANKFLFPFLESFCPNFQVFEFEYLELIYEPAVGTSTSGLIYLGYQPDPNIRVPESLSNFRSLPGTTWASPYVRSVMRLSKSQLQAFARGKTYFIRNEVSASDNRLIDQGSLLVGVCNASSDQQYWGDLTVRYKVRLSGYAINSGVPTCTAVSSWMLNATQTLTNNGVKALGGSLWTEMHDGLKINPYLETTGNAFAVFPRGTYLIEAIFTFTTSGSSTTQATGTVDIGPSSSFGWTLDGNTETSGTENEYGSAISILTCRARQILSLSTDTTVYLLCSIGTTGGNTWVVCGSDNASPGLSPNFSAVVYISAA